MRLLLAVLLAFGPIPAEARETAFDALSHLINEYAGPADQRAAEAAPDSDAPPGENLARVQSDLSLMAEGFELFRHPSHAARALRSLPERIVPELRPFFKDRASSLDTIYRTLAVTDYTWAARFPDPPCEPRSRRRALLAGKDGLFTDPKTGEMSSWLVRLLGPAAYGRSSEDALDRASSKRSLAERDYELLRLKVRKISEALESEKAVGSARSRLYCARAQAYEELASAHRTAAGAPIQAARGIDGSQAQDSARLAASVVLLAQMEGPDRYRALGAGVLIATDRGPRVLTDARVLPESDEDKLSMRAFARPQDWKTLGPALEFIVEKNDPSSGVMVGRLVGDDPIPALKLAGAEAVQDDLVRAIGHMSGTGAWTVSQGLVTATGKGTFATDALLGAEMLGSPLLNDQGEVAGLAVLRDGTSTPAAVASSRLRDLLADDGRVPASSDVEFIEGRNRGSASILSAAMPTVGGGLTVPGAKPVEASQYIYTQTQWGTVRGKCVANCGNASPSRGSSPGRSSYNSGGEELGKALGEALAPVVEALIFKGVPALFRGIGSLFLKSKSAPAAPPRRTPAREPMKAPEKPKEPARLTGLSLEAAPRAAAPGEKVTLTARVSLSDPEVSKANISVGFSASPATLARFDSVPRARTNGAGVATITATLRRDHGVRTVKTGDTKAVFGRSEGAHGDLDDEVRAMNAESTGEGAQEGLPEKDEQIKFGASANVGKALSAEASVVLSVQGKPECRFEPAEIPESFDDKPFNIKMRFFCTQVAGLPDIRLDGHEVILALTSGEATQTVTLRTDARGEAFAVFQANETATQSNGPFVRRATEDQFVNAANPGPPVLDIVEPARKIATDPVIRQFAVAGGAGTAIRVVLTFIANPLVGGAIVVAGGTVYSASILRKQMRADQQRYEKGWADSRIAGQRPNPQGNQVKIHIQMNREHGLNTQRCPINETNVDRARAQEMLTFVRKCGQNFIAPNKIKGYYGAISAASHFLNTFDAMSVGRNWPFPFGPDNESRIDIEIRGKYPYSAKE